MVVVRTMVPMTMPAWRRTATAFSEKILTWREEEVMVTVVVVVLEMAVAVVGATSMVGRQWQQHLMEIIDDKTIMETMTTTMMTKRTMRCNP